MKTKESYSEQLAKATRHFLDEEGVKYYFDEENGVVAFKTGGLSGKLKTVTYFIDIKDFAYLVYAVCPINAEKDDPEKIRNVAEFITRANYGSVCGAFEVDFSDGEVRYKVYVPCFENVPPEETIRESVYLPLSAFQRYGDGLIDVFSGAASPRDAVEKCDKNAEQ